MKLILSHPTRQGGSLTFAGPVRGIAHVVVGERVYPVRLVDALLSQLQDIVIEGDRLSDGEVWFEDDRERSH